MGLMGGRKGRGGAWGVYGGRGRVEDLETKKAGREALTRCSDVL